MAHLHPYSFDLILEYHGFSRVPTSHFKGGNRRCYNYKKSFYHIHGRVFFGGEGRVERIEPFQINTLSLQTKPKYEFSKLILAQINTTIPGVI